MINSRNILFQKISVNDPDFFLFLQDIELGDMGYH